MGCGERRFSMPSHFDRFRYLNDTGKPTKAANYGDHPIEYSYDGINLEGVIDPGAEILLDPEQPDLHVRSIHPEETSEIAIKRDV
jgi:hypothetical protein